MSQIVFAVLVGGHIRPFEETLASASLCRQEISASALIARVYTGMLLTPPATRCQLPVPDACHIIQTHLGWARLEYLPSRKLVVCCVAIETQRPMLSGEWAR